MFPQLSDLQIIELDPKIFRLNVDGERVELKAEEVTRAKTFVRACMNLNTQVSTNYKTKRLQR